MIPKQQHTTSPLILVMIVLLGIIVGYFYYSQITKDETFEVPVSASLKDPTFMKFKDLHFDFSLFSSVLFTSLVNVGEYPIEPGTTGKQDLFSF